MIKQLLFTLIFISLTGSAFSQSEQWKEYCRIRYQANAAFENCDYLQSMNYYLQMDSIYGRIVDYADMRHLCISATFCGDTNTVRNSLIALTQYKCFNISFLKNSIFDSYKKKYWWSECDSLSNIFGHKNQSYIDALRSMQFRDSVIRYQYVHAPDKCARDSLRLLMSIMDSIHSIKLQALIEEYGLPTWSNVGYEGFYSAYIIMMHINSDLQGSLIEQLTPLMGIGDVPRDKMAYLIDRSLIIKKLPQRYGCQIYRSGKSQPIEDIEYLNERREVMGLCPVNVEILKTKIVDYD